MKRNIQDSSKTLAYLLRHSQLPDHHGWVEVERLISELYLTLDELVQVIANDTKGRFELSEDNFSVRALYGHSIEVDLELEPSTPPTILYHGTATKSLASIMREGIRPRSRRFVHLSESIEGALEVGSRHGQPIVLKIATPAMLTHGHKFYHAQQGIWLTDSIASEYVSIINP